MNLGPQWKEKLSNFVEMNYLKIGSGYHSKIKYFFIQYLCEKRICKTKYFPCPADCNILGCIRSRSIK